MQYNVQSSTLNTRKWVGIVLAYPLLTAYGILLDCFNRRIFPLQNMINKKMNGGYLDKTKVKVGRNYLYFYDPLSLT